MTRYFTLKYSGLFYTETEYTVFNIVSCTMPLVFIKFSGAHSNQGLTGGLLPFTKLISDDIA